MTSQQRTERVLDLCLLIPREQDHEKFTMLVNELHDLLDENEERLAKIREMTT